MLAGACALIHLIDDTFVNDGYHNPKFFQCQTWGHVNCYANFANKGVDELPTTMLCHLCRVRQHILLTRPGIPANAGGNTANTQARLATRLGSSIELLSLQPGSVSYASTAPSQAPSSSLSTYSPFPAAAAPVPRASPSPSIRSAPHEGVQSGYLGAQPRTNESPQQQESLPRPQLNDTHQHHQHQHQHHIPRVHHESRHPPLPQPHHEKHSGAHQLLPAQRDGPTSMPPQNFAPPTPSSYPIASQQQAPSSQVPPAHPARQGGYHPAVQNPQQPKEKAATVRGRYMCGKCGQPKVI